MAEETKGSTGGGQGQSAERLEGTSRFRRPRRRTFYSIGEVCEMVGVKPHVLRYWESQFEELSPAKNRSGNRVYQAKEIELIALIHRLVHEERYTVEGAKRRLSEMQEEGEAGDRSTVALQRAFLRGLTEELQELRALLDPGAD
ncbi:MAG TPA: MerR family transcriptional regulator [Longimicrobiaceae bacterium]|nr:MerR family transcriptional regulator [Longimicrobiaceae bacterium]